MTQAHAAAKLTPQIIAEHGLKPDEYQVILDRLGREPNLVELGIFSVMWSEHCSYKSSRGQLSKFPTTGPRVIQGPGENAGVVDIGDGQAIVFKMESHNHPSFIEPYQGAATGVGGIMRDVFTMGARPIALTNALRFGAPDNVHTKRLVSGVVSGIAGYGNCVGVPTVAGETNFHPGYNGNILVNAMCVGLADADKIFYARGAQPNSPIVYFGSRTGRDGIHGATMASAEFDDASEEKRPTVQVGDPFIEKLLIEACLELMVEDAIEAIQDMGAAGLTSSSVEMAGKEGLGLDLDMNKVPVREEAMTPYEMMLSESQERMLAILKPGREHIAEAIMKKWDLDYAVIGTTTTSGNMVLRFNGEVVCDIPIAPLSEDAPKYDRPWIEPPKPAALVLPQDLDSRDHGLDLITLMASHDLCSRRWIWGQYDRHVMADTLDSSQSGGDAGIVRIHGTKKAVAISNDCTPRYIYADAYEGGKQVVAESYRNLCAVGAEPIAVTDNLNFGNPERPEIMGQIVRAIDGMAEACAALAYPVVSGNVSLYNETNGVGIPPTPVIGGVGLIADYDKRATLAGAKSGDALILMAPAAYKAADGHLGCSLYARHILGLEDGAAGFPPAVDLAAEIALGTLVRGLIGAGLVSATHDVSDGGVLVAAAEMAFGANLGVSVALDGGTKAFFGENQGLYLLATAEKDAVLAAISEESGAQALVLGAFGGEAVSWASDGQSGTLSLAILRQANEGFLPNLMA